MSVAGGGGGGVRMHVTSERRQYVAAGLPTLHNAIQKFKTLLPSLYTPITPKDLLASPGNTVNIMWHHCLRCSNPWGGSGFRHARVRCHQGTGPSSVCTWGNRPTYIQSVSWAANKGWYPVRGRFSTSEGPGTTFTRSYLAGSRVIKDILPEFIWQWLLTY
jgi:hypothetical protein